MIPLSCRVALPADLEPLARIHVAAWHHAYRDLIPAAALAGVDQAHGRVRLEGAIGQDPPRLVVIEGGAEEGGAPVGFCRFGPTRSTELAPNAGEVFAINVEPRRWRRGYGRVLLESALAHLTAQGLTPIVLWVLEGNLRARAFYEASGWTLDGAQRYEALGSEHPLAEVRYQHGGLSL